MYDCCKAYMYLNVYVNIFMLLKISVPIHGDPLTNNNSCESLCDKKCETYPCNGSLEYCSGLNVSLIKIH